MGHSVTGAGMFTDGLRGWRQRMVQPNLMSMVLGFLEGDTGPCEARVRAAVDGVYDRIYDGHGNWVFNTAYAATHGFTASVRRFAAWMKSNPGSLMAYRVVFSFQGDLTGAAIDSSNGHLAVIVGFDAAGNPIGRRPSSSCR